MGKNVEDQVARRRIAAILPLRAAQAMDVATFLVKADALEKMGMLALMSSDTKLLTREIEKQAGPLRAERVAAEKAGRRPAYCPPAKQSLTVKEVLTAFRTIPAAQRPRIQVKDALRAPMARKYPCRA